MKMIPPNGVLSDSSLLRNQVFIGGEWLDADDKSVFDVTNPATGELIGTVPCAGTMETRRAIDAANRSWAEWRTKTAKERAQILRRWHDLMLANADDLARILTYEQGKPLSEAKGEIIYAASFLEWFAEEAKRVCGETIPSPNVTSRLVITKEPIGVCAAITPWNFPAAMITRKVGPALAAGCPIIVKPAESTPFTALALAVLAERSGVPAGVFNVITGKPKEIGAEMTENPIVRKLSFTGSTQVGRLLMAQCAPTVKRVSLELGGNAPFIVFDDADLDAAVDGAIAAKYRNTGQTCVCVNRFYVHTAVYDEFARKLTARVEALRVGDGFCVGVQQGPLIDQAALAKVQAHIADALTQGATLATGGTRHELGGTFFKPTVLLNATASMQIASEETFGPVAALFRFTEEAEVIRQANASEYGLAAYFYARDIGRVWRVAEALEAGMVGINTGLISNEVAPFGGIKQSGLGREGSRFGIEDYLEVKYLCMGGI
jgi:succinate-semialdehyde dehydrogenase/glutarate-semialdehyde dehydrogenase